MATLGKEVPASGAQKQIFHFINGKQVEGQSGRGGKVYNPATGAVTAETPLATSAEVETAIASAQAAFPAWSDTAVGKRAQLMFAFRDKIIQHMDELAEILSSEHGKTLDDAKGEITRGLEVVEFACGIPQLLKGEHNQTVARGVDTWSMRQPLGVVAGITPFNFPAMIPLWMFPVAIACGNTFILKPSDRDPSTGIRLAELFLEAGAPPGVLHVINGDNEAVATLLSDSRVQ